MWSVIKHTFRDWRYYRYIDNWHSHPWLSWVMCKLGRHDYEVDKTTGDRAALLMCMYCCKRKHSTNSSSK